VRPVFVYASLIPFIKKYGGIEYIGFILSRLVVKICSLNALESCAAVLCSSQLRVGVQGGAEALVHSILSLNSIPSENGRGTSFC